jgi:hypothetical protein
VVECLLPKQKVASSNLVSRSKFHSYISARLFLDFIILILIVFCFLSIFLGRVDCFIVFVIGAICLLAIGYSLNLFSVAAFSFA